MTDLISLLNTAIEKEISLSMMYVWQYIATEKSDIRDAFQDSAIEKLKQAIDIGEHLFKLGDIPTGIPRSIGNSLKEMIELDLETENEVTKLYKEIIKLASKEEDADTRLLFEKILAKEQERKKVLMCAQGRLARRIM